VVIWLPLVVAGSLLAQAPAGGGAPRAVELIDAARLGDATRAAALLAAGARVETPDRRGITPLMWAAASGSLEAVTLLLEHGARVTPRARDGSTALTFAAANGVGPIVQALVTRGADVTATSGGRTARELAEARGHMEIAEYLRRAETLGAELLRAAAAGHTTLVRQLLALGAPVNISDERGATVLMMAASEGHLGLMQFLLARGADPLQTDADGQTAFDWADRSPELGTHVVAYLAAHGYMRPATVAVLPEAPPVRDSLASIDELLEAIPERKLAFLGGASAAAARRRVAHALAELQELSTRWPAESPIEYRDNLDALVQLLDASLRGTTAGGPATRHKGSPGLQQTLELLADDLEDKLEHCLASGGKLGGLVRVRVRTLRGSDEVPNWQVLYMPRIFELSETARPDVFPRFTSPSEETLPPGRYLVWLRDPASDVTGPRTIVRVGEGLSELLLDLPVPPDPAP
jgi:ankyrin repeat protein